MKTLILITHNDDATRAAMNGYADMELKASGVEPAPFMVWVWKDAQDSEVQQLEGLLGSAFLGSVVLA